MTSYPGASKPTYDIWGDTVNVASRLESSGVLGRIQVSEQVAKILSKHGQFEVDCRGPIFVKGKGQLTTYLVVTPYDCPEEESEKQPASGGCAAGACALGSDLADQDLHEPPPELAPDDQVEELCSESGYFGRSDC